MSALVEESLSVSGILLGKTMGRGNELADRFERESSQLADLEVRQRLAGRWVMASIQTSFSVMPALVYWFAGQPFLGTSISLGTVVAFTTLQTRLFFPVGSLLTVQIDVQTSLALFDRIFEYLDLPVEIRERDDAKPLPPCRGDITFDHVWFRYDSGGAARGADIQDARASPVRPSETSGRGAEGEDDEADEEWTLRDVSFEVPAGTRTAVVGETGSGKTTLGYLAARLYDVDRGRVLLDGIDVRDATFASLSQTIGVVSQETYLFHASIRENLRFAKPEATDEEIEAAARAARIHDLIASLEDGYDTVVGERGYRFSGGEKQRMAIARTILRNPPVLVLDEATSSLDTRTERAVQEELDRLSEGRTTITIAHRLSTIREADQIVVLDRGEVVERGTHDELIDLGGLYAALVARDEIRALELEELA
jgi:ATP-binding cassette subfamily B protein